jgi:GNAT superfamily N-acetyltransferase
MGRPTGRRPSPKRSCGSTCCGAPSASPPTTVVFDDLDAALAAHTREFTQELPHLLGPRGRLLVARANSEVVGVGALKPIDATVAEIKRMYVRPQARGQGTGRAILERLLADARTIGYRVARLETATFMREAHALYGSLGFRDRPIFDQAESGLSGLESFMLFMELRLDHSAALQATKQGSNGRYGR